MKYETTINCGNIYIADIENWCRENIGEFEKGWDWEWNDLISDIAIFKFLKKESYTLFNLTWL